MSPENTTKPFLMKKYPNKIGINSTFFAMYFWSQVYNEIFQMRQAINLMAILVKLFLNKTDVIVLSTNKILTQVLDALNVIGIILKKYLWITKCLKCKDIERHAKPFWGYIECILFI